ncbi:proliferation marker protein Ki-67 isoform 1-T2 [Hipposideros larvatus]
MGPTGHLVTIKRSGVDGPHFPLSLSTCLFGRGIECDIRIQLPVVSKQHCKIEVNERKAILFNFSSTNPTQVNGSAIDKPVQLKHGDVITIVDRSFRYENESHQNGSTSTEFPGQRREQASPRRVSMSGFSANPGGEVQDPKTCSKLTEESVLGRRLVHVGEVRAARPVSRASEEPVARETPRVHPSDLSQDDGRKAASPAAGDAQEVSRVTPLSGNGELKPFPSTQCLENSEESESPFRKLYESMKEELDLRPEKENVLRSRRKSGSRSHCAAENESADGLQGETPRLVSPKSRRTSGRGSQGTAHPSASGAQGSGHMGKRTGEGPVQTPKVTLSPSGPPMEARKTGTPRRRSQQSSTPKRRSGDLRASNGDEPEHLDGSGGFKADRRARLPRESLTRNQTPTKPENADNFGNTPGKVSSKKRRRSSVPADADVLNTEAEIQKHTAFAPLLLQKDRKMPDGALSTSGPLGAPAGPRCPGSPGLRSVDVSNVGDSTNMIEGMPLKRRRVSFGGHLRPELFDENLPPNTPVKRGETPMRRRSLVTHTATTVLKKIIKEQSQPPGQEDPSEIHLGVTAQNVFLSSPARNPVKTPAATDERRRSSEPSSASSGGAFPQRTDTPKREGRRSSSGPSKRMSVDRSQQEILQMIQSKRRSGASEANLIVAKSWADVVKLSAKQTQTKVIKHGPRRQLNKRQKRVNTPKKPTGSVHNQFSTGHANSPCTIVVGKAHIEKVNVPARPYRMLNHFMFNKKIDFNEDLSGLTEMFKTPAKEKPQAMSICPISFSNSEDFHRKKFQVLKSEEKPLLCTPENFGDNVFPSTQNVPKQTSYKSSASPALRLHCFAVKENRKTLPSDAEPPKVASDTNKFRRSMELRNTQVPGADCENKDAEANATENILGRHRRKTQQEEKLKEEMKENERTFETCKKNIESKENSEKMIAVKRSRRSSELKCARRADLITPKRLQQTEPKEDLVDTHSLFGTPGHAKEPVDVENRTTAKHCKSPEPDRVSTPAKMNARIKTPSQKVNVGELSALRKSTQTPEETTHSHREPVGDDKITEFFKETPEQILDAVENVTGSRRRSRTPKRKVQSLEDLAGFKELFQTPNRSVEPVTDNKTTKIPHKSPKPEPVNSPGGDNDIRAFKETPEQKVDPIENVTGSRRRSRTPKRKVQPLQDLASLKELFQTPNRTVEPVNDDKTFKITHKSPKPEPVGTPGDDKNIRAFTETPEQKLDPTENGTGSRRGSRTPKRKVQLTEDLAGLKELFQTPNHTVEPVTDDKTIKIPHKSPKPEPGNKPGDDKNRAFKETPEQKLDPTENVTGSRRRSRTPKRKVQPLQDLAGFKELFQTPNRTVEPVNDDKTFKITHKSPKPEPVGTPGDDKNIRAFTETPEQKLDPTENGTGSRRGSRTPKRKVQLTEDLGGLKELFQTPNRTVEPVNDDKTTKIPHKSPKPEPGNKPSDDKNRAFKETPEQKLDPTENGTGSRRGSRTPKRKVQLTEDLAGFKELFQTPNRTVEPVNDDKTTKIFCQSPQPEPVVIFTTMTRQLKTPPQKVAGDEELSALGKSTRTPGGTMGSPREAVGDDRIIELFKETPQQKLDPTENVTRSRRRSRTPKRKVQSLQDLAGLKELFQTPNHTVEPVTDDKTTKIPHKSPKPEPVNSPGGDNDIRAFKETPEQKLDPAENVTRSRKRPRTPKRKVQLTEDLAGFKELFQTPNRTVEPVNDDKTTKIFCQPPQPEPVVIFTTMTRQLQTPPRKVAGDEELSALGKSTRTPGGTMGSPREAVGDDRIIELFKETPQQKLDPTENVTRSRRRSRTPKRKVQSLQDLAGLKELFQTPNHTVEPVTDDKTIKIPHKSPKPEPGNKPGDDKNIRAFKETPEQKVDPTENVTGSRRRSRTPKRKVQPLQDLAGFKELFQTPNCTVEPVTDDKTTKIPHKSPKPEPVNSPGGDNDIRAFKETPEQKVDPTENVTGSRKRPRTPKRKVQLTEDLAGLKELFQTPNRTVEPVTDDKATKIPRKSPKPEPVNTPTSTKHRLQTPRGKVEGEEDLSALRNSTQTPGETTHSHGEPVGDVKDIKAFMETPEENLDSAENVTESRKRPRTPKKKVQPVEDLAGLKELFQTPNHTVEPVTDDKTKIPCKSPQAEAGMPTGRRSCLEALPEKTDVAMGPLALRKPTRASRKTTHSHRQPVDDDKDITVFKENAVQKQDPAKNVARSKRKPRTAKEKTQPLEDLTGLTELLQAPDHTDEPVTVVKTTRMRRQSPQPGPDILPSSKKRRLKAPAGKADREKQPSVLRKSARTGRSTRAHRELEEDDKDVTMFKETVEQKLDPAKIVARSMRKPRTAKEKTQPIEDLTGLTELLQVPDHTEEPVTVVKTTRMRRQSPQPGPGILPSSKKRQLKAPAGKADGEEQPLVLRKSARTGRSTRAHGEPVDGHKNVIVCEGAAKPKLGPADNTTGSKRLLRAGKGKAPALEGPAGCKELLQTADPDKDQGNDAESIKRTPMQRPDRREPVMTSRRVLRAPHVKPMDDLTGSRDPVKSQSKSSVSRSPKTKRGKDGTVPGGKRLRSTMCPQDTALEMPLQKRQGTAPRESCEPPEPLITKKKSQRVLAGRIESVEDLPSNSVRIKNKGQQAEAVTSPEKGRSLRSRHPNKTSAAERSPEFLESAEKIKVKRNEKKAPNTSREVKLQTLEDGAKNSASGGQVHERRTCLRSGRQSTKALPDATEEKAREKSVETHVVKKTQEEKEGPKRSGSTCLRSRKKTVPPTGDTLEESKQKVTQSTKRSAENVKKARG